MIFLIIATYIAFGIGSAAWNNPKRQKQLAPLKKEREETNYTYRRRDLRDQIITSNFVFFLFRFFLWPTSLIWNTTSSIRDIYFNSAKEKKQIKQDKSELAALEKQKIKAQIKALEERGEL